MAQVEFAEFLEDNAALVYVPEHDAKAPGAAELMAVAVGLQAKTDVDFNSALRLENGEVQLRYEERISASVAGGSIKVPSRFYLSIAPFIGCEKYLVAVRLRYRLTGGKLSFTYQLERPWAIVDSVVADTCKAIETGSGYKPMLGKAVSLNDRSIS